MVVSGECAFSGTGALSFPPAHIHEHRCLLSICRTMSRDQAAATLARIMGQPDAPAPAPAPIPHAAPASLYAGEDGGLALLGSGGSAAAAAGSRTSVSSAGSSAGVGYVTGEVFAQLVRYDCGTPSRNAPRTSPAVTRCLLVLQAGLGLASTKRLLKRPRPGPTCCCQWPRSCIRRHWRRLTAP